MIVTLLLHGGLSAVSLATSGLRRLRHLLPAKRRTIEKANGAGR
jgi:hypothetical protein